MELKKLYRDTVILCKKEVPQHDFLLWCDMAARSFLSRYPKKLLLPHGEYISPAEMTDTLMLDEEFYTAVIYFAAGNLVSSESYLKQSETLANAAYLKLWRRSAKGKRMRGDKW